MRCEIIILVLLLMPKLALATTMDSRYRCAIVSANIKDSLTLSASSIVTCASLCSIRHFCNAFRFDEENNECLYGNLADYDEELHEFYVDTEHPDISAMRLRSCSDKKVEKTRGREGGKENFRVQNTKVMTTMASSLLVSTHLMANVTTQPYPSKSDKLATEMTSNLSTTTMIMKSSEPSTTANNDPTETELISTPEINSSELHSITFKAKLMKDLKTTTSTAWTSHNLSQTVINEGIFTATTKLKVMESTFFETFSTTKVLTTEGASLTVSTRLTAATETNVSPSSTDRVATEMTLGLFPSLLLLNSTVPSSTTNTKSKQTEMRSSPVNTVTSSSELYYIPFKDTLKRGPKTTSNSTWTTKNTTTNAFTTNNSSQTMSESIATMSKIKERNSFNQMTSVKESLLTALTSQTEWMNENEDFGTMDGATVRTTKSTVFVFNTHLTAVFATILSDGSTDRATTEISSHGSPNLMLINTIESSSTTRITQLLSGSNSIEAGQTTKMREEAETLYLGNSTINQTQANIESNRIETKAISESRMDEIIKGTSYEQHFATIHKTTTTWWISISEPTTAKSSEPITTKDASSSTVFKLFLTLAADGKEYVPRTTQNAELTETKPKEDVSQFVATTQKKYPLRLEDIFPLKSKDEPNNPTTHIFRESMLKPSSSTSILATPSMSTRPFLPIPSTEESNKILLTQSTSSNIYGDLRIPFIQWATSPNSVLETSTSESSRQTFKESNGYYSTTLSSRTEGGRSELEKLDGTGDDISQLEEYVNPMQEQSYEEQSERLSTSSMNSVAAEKVGPILTAQSTDTTLRPSDRSSTKSHVENKTTSELLQSPDPIHSTSNMQGPISAATITTVIYSSDKTKSSVNEIGSTKIHITSDTSLSHDLQLYPTTEMPEQTISGDNNSPYTDSIYSTRNINEETGSLFSSLAQTTSSHIDSKSCEDNSTLIVGPPNEGMSSFFKSFHICNGTWQRISTTFFPPFPIPKPRLHNALGKFPRGPYYACGFDEVHLFCYTRGKQQKWERFFESPFVRRFATIHTLDKNTLWISGGIGSQKLPTRIGTFIHRNGTSTEGYSLKYRATGHCIFLVEGDIHVTCYAQADADASEVSRLNEGGEWETRYTLPSNFQRECMCIWQPNLNLLWLMGGTAPNGTSADTVSQDVYTLNFTSGSLEHQGFLPFPLKWGSTFMHNDELYIVGGRMGGCQESPHILKWDPERKTFDYHISVDKTFFPLVTIIPAA